jgi:hypothetical protein
MFLYEWKIINYPSGSGYIQQLGPVALNISLRSQANGKRFNKGRPNVLIVEADFLFVKYYGFWILLRFRKVIFKPEARSGNYIPPVLCLVSFRTLGLINSLLVAKLLEKTITWPRGLGHELSSLVRMLG